MTDRTVGVAAFQGEDYRCRPFAFSASLGSTRGSSVFISCTVAAALTSGDRVSP